MSSLGAWTYTDTITVWPSLGDNEYGEPSFGEPYAIQCNWEIGGEIKKDASGSEFSPSATVYFEAETGSSMIPPVDSLIAIGDQTSSPEAIDGAEQIRKVGGWSMSAFGESLNDYVLYTGKSRV